MQKDIKDLRIRFILIIVIIVLLILGFILGLLCWIINIGLLQMHIDPITHHLVMRGIVSRAFLILIIGVAIFALISFFASKWMVRPVEQTWKEQKQFVSDASHELKTPLTVITTNAELLQSSDLNTSDKEKYSGNILKVAKDMRYLVESLLNLARVEKGDEAGYSVVNFSDITSNILLQFEAVMYENGHNLISKVDPDIYIYASDRQILSLISILLDNANKYAVKGDISVELHSVNKNAVLTVVNESDYLSDAQLKDIFKRFYRADESHTEKGSYGLGLSIAKGICEACKGRIHADYNEGKVKFITSIPMHEKK